MDDELKAQMVAEILELSTPPLAQPGDITKEDYIAGWEAKYNRTIPPTTAQTYLDRAIRKGLLTKETVLLDGKVRRVYRKVQEDE